MAFALTLFVEAANRRVSPAVPHHQDSRRGADKVCEQLYQTLCADVDGLQPAGQAQPNYQTSLYAAFHTLWFYYQGDPLQAAVCARVLAFYFLMERSAGAELSEWVNPHPDTVQIVELHPALVEAIATVKLRGSVLLSEKSLLEMAAEKAGRTPK